MLRYLATYVAAHLMHRGSPFRSLVVLSCSTPHSYAGSSGPESSRRASAATRTRFRATPTSRSALLNSWTALKRGFESMTRGRGQHRHPPRMLPGRVCGISGNL
jgi:hypothetical protein